MNNPTAPVKETPVKNDIANRSIEELEQVEAYLHQHGLHAQATDVSFMIGEKIAEEIKAGRIPTYPESDTMKTLEAVQELVRRRHGNA